MKIKGLVIIALALASSLAVRAEEITRPSVNKTDSCSKLAEELSDSISKLFNLDEVTVSAKRREEPVIPVQKLSGSRLEGLSAQSVADAVRYFSGVQIKDYGGVGGLKTIDVRSLGTNHLGVFYDGIEIGNAQNGTVDLGKFSMDNLEEITLYNGQKSEIFQPAKDFGSAGTLYLQTRRPKFKNGKRYNLSVTMKAGSFGLANPSILYEQKITDDIHFSANAEYTFATGRYHFRLRKVLPDGTTAWDTTAVRENGDVQAWRGEAGFFGYLPEGKWHIKGYYYDSQKGIPGAIVNNVWKNSQRQWDRNAFVQGNFTKRVLKAYDVQGNAKYSNDMMRYLNPDTTLMYIDNTFIQQEIYLSLAQRLAIVGAKGLVPHKTLNWDIALSADWQWNYLEGTMVNFVFPERNTVLVSAATQLDWTYIKAQASVLGTFVYDKIHQPNRTTPSAYEQKPQWTPAIFLTAHPYLKDLYIRAFYKRIFRMPTFNDLYYTDIGNIALKPEYTTQYDAGAEYTKTWLRGFWRAVDLKVDGYFNQVKNKIVAIPKGNSQYRWQMMNLGYVEIRGVDVNASATMSLIESMSSPHQLLLNVAAAYTFQRAQDFSDPNEPLTYGGQIAYIPWHSGSATANLQWMFRQYTLSWNYAFIYVGERYHQSANIPANYERPWYTHDMSVSFEMPHWFFSMEVNNLLNQQYEIILNYPMPGLNGKVMVRYSL
ncbi:MAG: TonB-dependent receptor [Paludibacteraceae bacterium]|nr:TonB-dependent receptor [Paludibacteraceae bacterium]